jgi:hypothetical protein
MPTTVKIPCLALPGHALPCPAAPLEKIFYVIKIALRVRREAFRNRIVVRRVYPRTASLIIDTGATGRGQCQCPSIFGMGAQPCLRWRRTARNECLDRICRRHLGATQPIGCYLKRVSLCF